MISKVTDAVLDKAIQWQIRLLDEIYSILYIDCIVLKIRQDKRVINKSIYLALDINIEGHKELLGMGRLLKRRGKIQVLGAHRITTTWRERRADWLRGWPEGISRSDCCGVSQNANPVVYYSHGAQFVEVCSVEDAAI